MRRSKAISETFPIGDVPHITIVRPLKGLEPHLYECLAATFRLSYPSQKLTIYLCISSHDDPALAIAQQVLRDFPLHDATLLVEEDDEHLQIHAESYGPNPKIRNMSRAYREAKGDLVWIIDCNVWVAKGVAGRFVDTIEGLHCNSTGQKYKLVHQLPLCVDVTNERNGLSGSLHNGITPKASSTSTYATSIAHPTENVDGTWLGKTSALYGGRLEEMFLSSSHAKMYTSINTFLLAPCIVGKSTMFRRSHLNALTRESPEPRPQGIDYFSFNICEDHLIGDVLWKQDVPEEAETGSRMGKHALLFGDLAIQPVARMSVNEYVARRVRWLRVRKFTVLAATLVEPGTESMLSSVYGAYGVSTCNWVHQMLNVPQTWSTFAIFWLCSICLWTVVDWYIYQILHSMASIDSDEHTPEFARPRSVNRRAFSEWLLAWIGREGLAPAIWTAAVWGGTTVKWRGKRFRVGMDMRVHPVDANDSVAPTMVGEGPIRATSGVADAPKFRRE